MTKIRLIYCLKSIYFFIKKYKFEMLTAFSGIALLLISILYTRSNDKLALAISVFIIFITTIIFIIFKTMEKDFYFIGMHHLKDKNDWMGSGTFELVKSEYAYVITNATPGYIFSKCLTWGNYKYEFSFKILKDRLGIVIRAANLSNYLMLQINPHGIRPHLLINGGWKIWEAEESRLTFQAPLSFDEWYKCKVSLENNDTFIKIYQNNKEIFNRSWSIPRGIILDWGLAPEAY